jgi:hypothetical protein
MNDIEDLSKYLSERIEVVNSLTAQIAENPTLELYKALDVELERIINAIINADFPINDRIRIIFTKSMKAKTLNRRILAKC